MTPDETYELPGVISAKSPLMVCLLTEPLVVTRRLTDAPATLPMLAMTHPPLLLGEPLAVAPAKEKVVTSPQNTGGEEGGGGDGGVGGGGGVGGAALPWTHVALVVMHALYCGVLIVLGFPILKIHIGLVARNELAAEWKRNDHEVIDRGNGQSISVNELDDDEFNERFDSFVYDRSRNKFDKGCCSNCLSFWCTKRWSRSQLGDF